MDVELEQALIDLEKELDLPVPMGMDKMPPSIRYSALIIQIKKMLCPHIHKINTDGAQVLTSTVDALLSYVTALPLVAATIGKYIYQLGLERFCREPTALIDVRTPDDE